MTLSTTVFLLVVAGMLVHALAAVLSRVTLPVATRVATSTAIVVLWLVIPGVLAAAGRLDAWDHVPPPALVMVALLAVATLALGFSPVGAHLAQIDLVWLVGFQSFRIPVEWWLHEMYRQGVVPVQMTYVGRNFDIVSGVTALALGLWLALGQPPRAAVWVWNLLGFALLCNVVVIAVGSTPTPLRVFMNDPPVRLPSMFPYLWLPTFLVPSALMGHLLVFRALLRDRRRAQAGEA